LISMPHIKIQRSMTIVFFFEESKFLDYFGCIYTCIL
jgi:hypothetical protein